MYTRPEIVDPIRRDDRGAPIPYGSRWGAAGAPEEFYSVCEHPERFRPLLAVGRALVDHLAATYDVDVRRDPGPIADRPEPIANRPGSDGFRRQVLLPRDPAAAPLEIALREPAGVGDPDRPEPLPGLRVRAGALFEHGYPECGCDGCDDPVGELAEDLEQHVFAVVGGRLREAVTGRQDGEYTWVLGHGAAVYESATRRIDGSRPGARRAAQVLGPVEGVWAPWSPRRA